MIVQFILGGTLIGLSVLFHALALDFIIKKTKIFYQCPFKIWRKIWKACVLTILVLAVCVVLILEMWLWASLYLTIGALHSWESALYFSVSSFTTVGYGDLVLPTEWRLLVSIEAANGFLLFGWSTAFIFEIVSSLYKKESKSLEG